MLVTDVLTHVLESHVLSLNSYTHISMVNGTNGVCVSVCTSHLCVCLIVRRCLGDVV